MRTLKYAYGKYGLSDLTKNAQFGSSGIRPSDTISLAGDVVSALDSGNEFGRQTTGSQVASNALKYAGMGMAFGPIGAGVGAVVGAGLGLIQGNKQRKTENAFKTQRTLQSASLAKQNTAQMAQTNPDMFRSYSGYYRFGGNLRKKDVGGPIKPIKRDAYYEEEQLLRQLETDEKVSMGAENRVRNELKNGAFAQAKQTSTKRKFDNPYSALEMGSQYTRDWFEKRGYSGAVPGMKTPTFLNQKEINKAANVDDDRGQVLGVYVGADDQTFVRDKQSNPTLRSIASHEVAHRGQQWLMDNNKTPLLNSYDQIRARIKPELADDSKNTATINYLKSSNEFDARRFQVNESINRDPMKKFNRFKFMMHRLGNTWQGGDSPAVKAYREMKQVMPKRDIMKSMNEMYRYGGPLKRSLALGGTVHALSKRASFIEGPSHEKGGVKFPKLGVELEGDETTDGNFVFSKTLGYADKHLPLAQLEGELENAQQTKQVKSLRTLTRKSINGLKRDQEYHKEILGINDSSKKEFGGIITADDILAHDVQDDYEPVVQKFERTKPLLELKTEFLAKPVVQEAGDWLTNYKNSIGKIESGNNYFVAGHNKSSARGKYQFLASTLKQMGISRDEYIRNPQVQENAMDRYTMANVPLARKIQSQFGGSFVKHLGGMHLEGSNGYLRKLKQGRLNTATGGASKNLTTSTYLSRI